MELVRAGKAYHWKMCVVSPVCEREYNSAISKINVCTFTRVTAFFFQLVPWIDFSPKFVNAILSLSQSIHISASFQRNIASSNHDGGQMWLSRKLEEKHGERIQRIRLPKLALYCSKPTSSRNNVNERDGKTKSWMRVDGICSGRRHFQIIYYLVS
jgi:hypothetical protein